MYKFKIEKYEEILNGRTVEWLSKELGYTNMSLYALFNGRRTCKKAFALAVCSALNIDKNDIEEYFYKVEGE